MKWPYFFIEYSHIPLKRLRKMNVGKFDEILCDI